MKQETITFTEQETQTICENCGAELGDHSHGALKCPLGENPEERELKFRFKKDQFFKIPQTAGDNFGAKVKFHQLNTFKI